MSEVISVKDPLFNDQLVQYIELWNSLSQRPLFNEPSVQYIVLRNSRSQGSLFNPTIAEATLLKAQGCKDYWKT